MQGEEQPEVTNATGLQSVAMLKAVIDGQTYAAVAARFGVTRTAVERRIKAVAVQLSQRVGIVGADGT